MKKIIALFLAVIMVLSFAACGDKKNQTDGNTPQTNNTNNDTNSNNNETVSEPESDVTNETDSLDNSSSQEVFVSDFDGTYEIEFADFNNAILSYEKKKKVDGLSAGFIPYPSTRVPQSTLLERIYTRDDLFTYLDKYVDMKSDMDANIIISTMNEHRFEYRDKDPNWNTQSFTTILQSRMDYYFVGHPEFAGLTYYGLNEFRVDNIYYDKDTGNLYVVLKDFNSSVEKQSDTSYGLFYIKGIDEFAKSNKIGKVYIVYQSQSETDSVQ